MDEARELLRKPTTFLPHEFATMRHALAWDRQTLGRRMGVSAQVVAAWEDGDLPVDPVADRFIRLAAVCFAPMGGYTSHALDQIASNPGEDANRMYFYFSTPAAQHPLVHADTTFRIKSHHEDINLRQEDLDRVTWSLTTEPSKYPFVYNNEPIKLAVSQAVAETIAQVHQFVLRKNRAPIADRLVDPPKHLVAIDPAPSLHQPQGSCHVFTNPKPRDQLHWGRGVTLQLKDLQEAPKGVAQETQECARCGGTKNIGMISSVRCPDCR